MIPLSRPKAALPNSYFWTWDHSTNWILDDEGIQTFGSYNRYMKKPQSFIQDYDLLSDLAKNIGIKGITIWGFLRDSHGGEEAAKKVAYDAMNKGIYIMPGVGTTWYGGIYYEGEHPYHIETFLKKNPKVQSMSDTKDYKGVCPSHPLYKEWIEEGLDWLFTSFDIGGINLENGDFFMCSCEKCSAHKKNWPKNDPEFFRLQELGYRIPLTHLTHIKKHHPDHMITWGTYTGFAPGIEKENKTMTPYLGCDRPKLFDTIPDTHSPQFTLTRMVRQDPLPLTDYLYEGVPEEVFHHTVWDKELMAPLPKSVGFIHQGSQWRNNSRYHQIISTIKESCLRAYLAGMSGISIHGEVSEKHIPSALNYLAFSHFIHWPTDSIFDFGKKTLGELFDSEEEGVLFVQILAHWDSAMCTKDDVKQVTEKRNQMLKQVDFSEKNQSKTQLYRFRFWQWLYAVVTEKSPHMFF